jgi:hypothetical protein
VPINTLDHDSAADPFDEADIELPDEKTMIEQFMAGLAQEVDNKNHRGLAHLLSTLPEMKLYKHATTHKWTADELISTAHSSKRDEAHSCGPDSESHFSAGEKIS